MSTGVLYIDGASHGNPGPSACAFALLSESGGEVSHGAWYLGDATNNIAAYMALVWGMQNALASGFTAVDVRCDSQLVALQMGGALKVKTADLVPLYRKASDLAGRFESFSITRIRRAENHALNELACEALDERSHSGSYAVPLDAGQDTLFQVRDEVESPSESVFSSDASFLYKGGYYELTIKSRFEQITPTGDPVTWSVEARVSSEELDAQGRVISLGTLQQMLADVIDGLDGANLSRQEPFDALPATMEHLARVIFWRLDPALPPRVQLDEVGIWSSAIGAKIVYRP